MLSGSTQDREGSRIRQIEKLSHETEPMTSTDPIGSSEAEMALQGCPKLEQENQALIFLIGPVIEQRLP